MPSHFDWNAGYPSRRLPVFARDVVATSHPLAVQAGLRLLMNAGNAVDAAMPLAFADTCRCVAEPASMHVSAAQRLDPQQARDFGAGQFSWRRGEPGSDPRRDGQAGGF